MDRYLFEISFIGNDEIFMIENKSYSCIIDRGLSI